MAKKKAAKRAVGSVNTVKKTALASKRSSAVKPAILYKIHVGDRVPAFKTPSHAGATRASAEFKAGLAVLYFYPKDMTSGCTLEGRDFARLQAQFKKHGCEIFGVSRDSIKSHTKFAESCEFRFELLSDEQGELCRAFDVIQMKSMYGRKYEGIERSTFVIGGGKVLAEWRKVKVPGHAEEVLKKVSDLAAGLKGK